MNVLNPTVTSMLRAIAYHHVRSCSPVSRCIGARQFTRPLATSFWGNQTRGLLTSRSSSTKAFGNAATSPRLSFAFGALVGTCIATTGCSLWWNSISKQFPEQAARPSLNIDNAAESVMHLVADVQGQTDQQKQAGFPSATPTRTEAEIAKELEGKSREWLEEVVVLMTKAMDNLRAVNEAQGLVSRQRDSSAKALHQFIIDLFADRFFGAAPSLSAVHETSFLEDNPCTLSDGRTLDSQSVVAIRILDQAQKTRAIIWCSDTDGTMEDSGFQSWQSGIIRSMLLAGNLSESFVNIGYGPKRHSVNPNKVISGKIGSPLLSKFTEIKQGLVIPRTSTDALSLFHEGKSSSTWAPSENNNHTFVRGTLRLNESTQSELMDILVDTGATITVIDPKCVPKGIPRMKVKPTSIGGLGGSRVADTAVPLEIGIQGIQSSEGPNADTNAKISAIAYILPIPMNQLIIGMDTLQRLGASLDIGASQMTIGPSRIQLYHTPKAISQPQASVPSPQIAVPSPQGPVSSSQAPVSTPHIALPTPQATVSSPQMVVEPKSQDASPVPTSSSLPEKSDIKNDTMQGRPDHKLESSKASDTP